MRLEYDLEIRDLSCGIVRDGLGMDIGDGWREIAVDAIGRLAEVSHGRLRVDRVGEKWGMLNIRPLARGLGDDTIRAIFEITSTARSRSSDVCELCGRFGEIRRAGWHRVRCDDCENEHVRRRQFESGNHKDIDEAVGYYVRVCLEHGRLFPVANIVMQAWPDDTDRRFFLDEVNDVVGWWRAGMQHRHLDENLREEFRSLRFR
ncbi:hypothetical protein [Shinella zoogloeoides]|uniref:hypothetical protein n=1 Tax=Shinella zoogloeoides TaxID=352475 RepID=UPI0028A982A4|nr:hypothetical protein [Shinella zoogloeoides]